MATPTESKKRALIPTKCRTRLAFGLQVQRRLRATGRLTYGRALTRTDLERKQRSHHFAP